MAAKYKLDIFDLLRALDRRDMNFYDNLEDDVKKAFTPVVAMRWQSAVINKNSVDYHILAVNELVNKNFWNVSNHPELIYKLMASVGNGPERHIWIAASKKQKESQKLKKFISDLHPSYNDFEIDLLLSKYDNESFEKLVYSAGLDDSEIKELVKAYGSFCKENG